MASVTKTPDAEYDLLDIWTHIAESRIDVAIADTVLDAIGEKCKLIATQPELGTLRPELAPNVRSFQVYDFIVFYRPARDGIHVLRVIHGSRDIEPEFRKSRFGPGQ